MDLVDPARRIFQVHEVIPVSGRGLSLHYPKWIPGEHAPSGPIDSVTGLVVTTDNGERVEWRRDLSDMFTLHLALPAGARLLHVDFEFLSAGSGGDFGQSVSVTSRIQDLEWNQVLFYPSGYAARSITVRPSIRLPAGWNYATALQAAGTPGDAVDFAPVSLEQLVDSPLVTGMNFARLDLAPGGGGAGASGSRRR